MRIPIKATAREPIKQAGYISATSETYAISRLRTAVGPYIRVSKPKTQLEHIASVLLPPTDNAGD